VIERKPLRKSVRFAIFHRDGFTCAYCGRRPPKVVLEIDHIVPIAEGGTNDDTNLTTCCEECNAGKGRKLLASAGPKPDVDLDYLATQQELAELERYNRLKVERDRVLDEVIDNLQKTWMDILQDLGAKGPLVPRRAVIAGLLLTFTPEDIEWSFRYAISRTWYRGRDEDSILRYACACLWNELRRAEGRDDA
jgi:hypothetical protein